jgi:DNA-binding Xre family transcriptional regulator
MIKLNKICPAVDVSPKDLADHIIGEFKWKTLA